MYVCICKGITDSQIRAAIHGGLCTRKEISGSLKVGTACGKCNKEVQAILQSSPPPRSDRSGHRYEVPDSAFRISTPTCSSCPEASSKLSDGVRRIGVAPVDDAIGIAACPGPAVNLHKVSSLGYVVDN